MSTSFRTDSRRRAHRIASVARTRRRNTSRTSLRGTDGDGHRADTESLLWNLSRSRKRAVSMSQVIILHGPSSSGKSTTARALQAKIEKPFWHISIDHLRDSGVLPTSRFKSGEFDWKAAKPAFFNGFHASLAAYANAGNNLILEHILDKDQWLTELRELLAGHDVYFVGVHCQLGVLIAREAARGDRPLGSAQADFQTVHAGKVYDLEIRSEDGLDDNVDRILSGWRTGLRASSFT